MLFDEVVDMALAYGYIQDEKEAYCKDCGEPLTNGAIIWKNMKIGWNFSGNRFQSDKIKKTFLHYRRYGLTNYRLCRCDKCIKKKFPEYKGNLCSMSANYVQYAFNVADVDFIPMRRKACVRSLDSFIEKYGEESGNRSGNHIVSVNQKSTHLNIRQRLMVGQRKSLMHTIKAERLL